MKRNYLNQKERLLLNLVSLALLFLANYLIFGTYIPSLNEKSLWFLCALLNIFLANHLFSPFFIKPIDSLSFGITAFTSLIMIKYVDTWSIYSKVLYMASEGYFIVIIILAIICILLKDSKSAAKIGLSEQIKTILFSIGSANVIFLFVLFFALVTYHYPSGKEIIGILFVYIVLVDQDVIQELYLLIIKICQSNQLAKKLIDSGEIVAYQEPNIVLVKQDTEKEIPYMTCIIIKDSFTEPKLGFSLDFVGKADGVLLRTFVFEKTNNKKIISDMKSINYNSVLFVDKEYFVSNGISIPERKIIGLVSSDSSIDYLTFEIIVDEDIRVGTLINTYIQGKSVIYQVINGFTKEEIVQKKNTFGYINVFARKIGEWNTASKTFVPNNWLPRINTEVHRILEIENQILNPSTIGTFPDSKYSVYIKDINSLVTHNTAILGILGIGKSMLAIELIERLLAENIKVVCLDLTNQYKIELAEFIDEEYEQRCINSIQEAGKKDRELWAENAADGGSLKNFAEAIRMDLNELLTNINDRNLKIYNPSQLFATKQREEPRSFQVGGRWQRGASVYALTAVEITQIISETILDLISDNMTDKARICIVLEEAHSLVPEYGSVVADSDKYATNGTARAILQGRKYGFGCILITQRTANVTKTILNQCNNIFAMRTFDDTGKNFLSNYIGEDYTKILSSIPARHAVFFGKSSSCENPVLLRLNDKDVFRNVFRNSHPVKTLVKVVFEESEAMLSTEDEFEDDELPGKT